MDRKGILHTVSFAHLNQMIERTRHAPLFLSNDVKYAGGMRKTADVVETFREATPPAVLASPSITAGWDFKDEFCRYQFILKVPFPDTQSLVDKARKKLDPEYHDNKAMTSLVQIVSRSCRSDMDFCENVIPDTRVGWFLHRKKHLAPSWFLGARGSGRFRRLNEGVVPEPIKG
jgi:Ackermannviridae DNA helicase